MRLMSNIPAYLIEYCTKRKEITTRVRNKSSENSVYDHMDQYEMCYDDVNNGAFFSCSIENEAVDLNEGANLEKCGMEVDVSEDENTPSEFFSMKQVNTVKDQINSFSPPNRENGELFLLEDKLTIIEPQGMANKKIKRRAAVIIPNEINEKKVQKFKKPKKKTRKRKNSSKGKVILPLAPICKFYQEGRCNKGTECDFRHEGPLNLKNEPCKFYVRDGTCLKGEFCAFMHKNFPCKFFFWGSCKQGDDCRFSHDPLTPESRLALEQHLKATENTKDGEIESKS